MTEEEKQERELINQRKSGMTSKRQHVVGQRKTVQLLIGNSNSMPTSRDHRQSRST
jgi:hypothetical protein